MYTESRQLSLLQTLTLTLGMAVATHSHAELASNAKLAFDESSQFTVEVAPGFKLPIHLQAKDGLLLGRAQTGSGTHAGLPTGKEHAGIDTPFVFFGGTGLHLTTRPVTVERADGGEATLDFSGWSMEWNGIRIPLGNARTDTNEGLARIICDQSCASGEHYNLSYSTRIPASNSSPFAGRHYELQLSGVIASPDSEKR